jgi:hypothetical protein
VKKLARTNIMQTADYWLLAIVIALLCIGLVMIFSASSSLSYTQSGRLTYYFERQLLWLLVGAAALYGFSRIDYRFWQQWPIAVAVILTTVIVLAVFLLLTRGRQPDSMPPRCAGSRWRVRSPWRQPRPSRRRPRCLASAGLDEIRRHRGPRESPSGPFRWRLR